MSVPPEIILSTCLVKWIAMLPAQPLGQNIQCKLMTASEPSDGNFAGEAPNQAKPLCAGYAPTMRGIENHKPKCAEWAAA